MKTTILILVIGILFISYPTMGQIKNQESISTLNTPKTKDLSILIDNLYMVDQAIQQKISNAAQNGENEKLGDLFAAEKEIFERHIPILKEIFEANGYPTIELVGKESSSNFFTLVQHADSDIKFQAKMLKAMTQELKKGNISPKNFAFLTDRVQLAQQKSQIYGTQVKYNTDIGQASPKNLVDSLNVNKRRKEMGLEPIEVYLNEVSIMHFKINKAHYDEIGVKEPKLYKIELQQKLKNKNMKLGAFSVSLSVKDLKISKAFYENLGFEQLAGSLEQNYLIMKNENSLIGLFQGMFQGNILTFNPGWDESGAEIDQFVDIREIQNDLKGKGIDIGTEIEKGTSGPASFMITDPDGNVILIDQHR